MVRDVCANQACPRVIGRDSLERAFTPFPHAGGVIKCQFPTIGNDGRKEVEWDVGRRRVGGTRGGYADGKGDKEEAEKMEHWGEDKLSK